MQKSFKIGRTPHSNNSFVPLHSRRKGETDAAFQERKDAYEAMMKLFGDKSWIGAGHAHLRHHSLGGTQPRRKRSMSLDGAAGLLQENPWEARTGHTGYTQFKPEMSDTGYTWVGFWNWRPEC